jgi:prevent-host-death family protein
MGCFVASLPDVRRISGTFAIVLRRGSCPLAEVELPPRCGILVSMTRIRKASPPASRRPKAKTGKWLLQDAKARFSELVRRVHSEGPQRVTVHGRDEVVVISAEEFRRLKGDISGKALIDAMQASPYRDIDVEPERTPMPVRKVSV